MLSLQLPQRKLGKCGLVVSTLGLGCMGMSEFYGETNEDEAVRTLKRAFELGVNFFDTADVYGYGKNEELLGRTFGRVRDQIIIASKCGIVRDKANPKARGIDCSFKYIKEACEASLRRLKTDYIDLFYLHRMDQNVPIEESMEALVQLMNEGKIKYIGLSEAKEEIIQRANSIWPITALQTEYSFWSRSPEKSLLPLCRDLGIGFVPYSPLGRGFLTGTLKSKEHLSTADFRRALPRFQEDNVKRNSIFVEVLGKLAKKKNCTVAQIALAWVLAQGDDIVPIPGTKCVKYLEENLQSHLIELTKLELAELETAVSQFHVAGERYTPEMMAAYGLED